MKRKLLLHVVALALVVASCEEHLPRPLGGASATPEVRDAQADAADASTLVPPRDGSSAESEVVEGGICNVRVAAPAVVTGTHVPEGSPIAYASNPPSSGPHYPVWANFQEYAHPVADGYLVHSLEHGAVVLLYKCPDDAGDCLEMVSQLRAVRDAVATDLLCDASVRVRIVIAPRAANDAAVTAAAWGNTYRADCVDASSLAAFVRAHYGRGPEDLCYPSSLL